MSYKVFLKKQKMVWYWSPCHIFNMISEEKYLSSDILLTDKISLSGLSLLHEILGNFRIAIVCQPGCDFINFEINLIFLIKPIFLHDQ